MAVVLIESTHPPSQGPFVRIDEKDYDPAVHRLYHPEQAEPAAVPPVAEPEHGQPRPRARRKP